MYIPHTITHLLNQILRGFVHLLLIHSSCSESGKTLNELYKICKLNEHHRMCGIHRLFIEKIYTNSMNKKKVSK